MSRARTKSKTRSTGGSSFKAPALTAKLDTLPAGAPFIPDGTYNFGMYDAVSFSDQRSARPFFAVDSQHTLTSWSRLRALALARWAYINVPVVKGAVDLMGRLTVGTGFTPHTLGANKEISQAADDYYLDKASDIGFMHGESMDELLLHDCRCADVDGDLGYVMTSDEFDQPKLQLIEGHRIKTGEVDDPNCRDGMWVDKFGRWLAANVALPEEGKTKRIEAKDFIYLAERNRPDELRSMTALIHALNPIQDLYEYFSFAMQSAKKNAEIAAVIETPTPDNPPLGPTFSQIQREAQAASGGQPAIPRQTITREQVYKGGGKIPILKPGEKFTSYEPKNPIPDFEALPTFIIRGISVGYGTPFEVLWNPEAIGGANTRLITALLRARLQQRRATLIFPKLNRIRFWILARGIKRGELKANYSDIAKCTWSPNFSDITVDAGRESKERRANVQCGLDTFTGYFSENGANYADEIAIRVNDARLQCAGAAQLVKEFPQLSFAEALARMSILTPSGMEVQEKVVGATDKTSPSKKPDAQAQQ